MKQKRGNHTAEFKARIGLEAIKRMKTVQQIAADHHLHPVQVTQSKMQRIESAAGVFVRGRGRKKEETCSERECHSTLIFFRTHCDGNGILGLQCIPCHGHDLRDTEPKCTPFPEMTKNLRFRGGKP